MGFQISRFYLPSHFPSRSWSDTLGANFENLEPRESLKEVNQSFDICISERFYQFLVKITLQFLLIYAYQKIKVSFNSLRKNCGESLLRLQDIFDEFWANEIFPCYIANFETLKIVYFQQMIKILWRQASYLKKR